LVTISDIGYGLERQTKALGTIGFGIIAKCVNAAAAGLAVAMVGIDQITIALIKLEPIGFDAAEAWPF